MELKSTGFQEFLRWWVKQLSELLPSGMRVWSAKRPDALIIEASSVGVILWLRRQGQTTQLARAAAGDSGIQSLAQTIAGVVEPPHLLLFRVPRSMQLRKLASFPLAARGDLATVLGFEMDRETPFGRGEVYWDYVIRRQDTVAGRLDVELFIVPRGAIDPAIEASRRAGLHPGAIEIDTGADEFRLIRIGASRRWQWFRSQRQLMRMVAAGAGLFVIALATPVIWQQIGLALANSRIERLTGQARDAAALRQSVDQVTGVMQLIKKEHDRNGGVLEVLAAATSLLPDDSYLTALSLRSGRLTITGQSPAAAHLVDLLGKSPGFREPAFDSPVVQDEQSGLETFTISATVAADGLMQQIGTRGEALPDGEKPRPLPNRLRPVAPAEPAAADKQDQDKQPASNGDDR